MFCFQTKGVPLAKDEVALLIDLVEANKVITSKATNNQLKEAAWSKLTDAFNASISSCSRRTDQLKLKWENLKKSARKRSTKIRMNQIKVIISSLLLCGGVYEPQDVIDIIFI